MAGKGPERRRRGCLRLGCIGCFAIVVFPAVALAVVVGLGLAFRPEARVERPRIAHDPPVRSHPGESGSPAEPGRVVLDFSLGELEIVPGPPGTAIRVEAEYDAAIYELEESFERVGELGWIYRLGFHRAGWLWHVDTAEDSHVRLILPREMPVTLEGRLGIGAFDLELGGLSLVDVDLQTGTGDFRIRFSEPLPQPSSSFRLRGSIGDTQVHGLGNASPARVRTRHRVGDFRLDLGGEWRNDADVESHCGLGACAIELPRDVNVEIEELELAIGEIDRDASGEGQRLPGRPTIRLRAYGKLGDLRVRR